MSGDGARIYQSIFAGVSSKEELRHAIAIAVSELRAAMEKESNPAVTLAHVRNLDDVAPAALAEAYAQAEQNCVYWPTPGQIRELAGCSAEQEARESLEAAFAYLIDCGSTVGTKGGGAVFGDDGSGRRVLLEAKAAAPSPALPPVLVKSLALLGSGSLKDGLLYLRQHPRMKGWDETGGEAAARTAERIERQWVRCHQQALREQQQKQSRAERAK